MSPPDGNAAAFDEATNGAEATTDQLRDIHDRSRSQVRETTQEPATLVDVIARAAKARGVTLGEPTGFVHCDGIGNAGGCDELVRFREQQYCPACLLENRRLDRRNWLHNVREMVPNWPHAKFETDPITRQPRIPNCHDQLVEAAHAWKPWGDDGRSPRNLCLLGKSGLGKTTAAVAKIQGLLNKAELPSSPQELFAKAQGVRWFQATELASARSRTKLGVGEAKEIRQLRHARLVVVDDFGKEDVRDRFVMSEVIEDLYRLQIPALVTSELSVSAIRERYTYSTQRRLTDLATVKELVG